MMRTYRPMRLAPYDLSPMLRSDLQGVDTWLRQLSTYMARVPVLPQGQPTATTPVAVTPGTGSSSLDDYLFLPGRIHGQLAYGSNVNNNATYAVDRLTLIANRVDPDSGSSAAPGAVALAKAGISFMGSIIDFNPTSSSCLDGFPTQPMFITCNQDLVHGDNAQITIQRGIISVSDMDTSQHSVGNDYTCYFNTYGSDQDVNHRVLQLGASSTYLGKHLVISGTPSTSILGFMQGADWATTGRFRVGDGSSFSTRRLLDLSDTTVTTNGTVNQFNQVMTITASGAASAAYTGYNLTLTDSNTFSSGNYNVVGLGLTSLASPATGSTLSNFSGFNGTVTASGGGGTATNVIAGIWTAQGGAAGLPAITTLIGQRILVGHRSSAVTTVKGIEFNGPGGSTVGAVTDHIGIDFLTAFGNGANVTTWHGIRHTAGPVAAIPNKWFLDLTSSASSLGNRIVYKTALGWNPGTVAAVTAMLHLGPGTTALAPLMFTTGTSLTTPLAGAVEMTTDDLFFTITTGTARKAFILSDGTNLTSGRVPFATTNGRLIDQAGFTFGSNNLAVPGNGTFGTAGTAETFVVGQGAGGSDNATLQIQAAATGVPSIYLFQQATEYARWTKDGTNTTWIGTGTLQFQQEVAVGTNVFKMGAGGVTAGVTGTGHNSTFGQGTTGADGSVLTIRSGNSGTTKPVLSLNRNGTDLSQLFTDGTDTFMDFQGDYRFRSGLAGTGIMRVQSTGPLVEGGARIRFDGFTNGAGVGAGTLTNAPAAGNPAFWLKVNIAGTDRFIPCW